MNDNEFELTIDETDYSVSFKTQSLTGAKGGIAELKRRKKLVSFRRRDRMAQLRLNRSAYWGTREISRSVNGGWLSGLIYSWMRFSAYSKTAVTDHEIAHIDRILIAIDRAILDIETEVVRLKSQGS